MTKIDKPKCHSILPDDFSKASSDDEIDIGRKLDKANVLLSTLVLDNKTGFNNLNKDLNSGFNNLTDILGTFIKGQAEHNKRLEAILEKLVDKA